MPLEHRLHNRCACGSSLSSHSSQGLSAPRPFPFAGTPRQYERPRPFVIRHIALDLTLDCKKKGFSATARIDVSRVDAKAKELTLDAVGFEISAVEVSTGEAHGGGTSAKGKKAEK